MKAYPLVEELLAPVLRGAMPCAVRRPALLRRHIPSRGSEELFLCLCKLTGLAS